MTIPANITTEITALQAQVAAAAPLTGASQATLTAMQLNAAQLVRDIDGALTSAAGVLDTWTAPVGTALIIAGIVELSGNAQDQSTLAKWRGYIGRATSNLDQLV